MITYTEVPALSEGDVDKLEIRGRTKISIWWKLNIIWWFGNNRDPWPPAWYKPESAFWWRTFLWYLRNRLQNFGNYVVGVFDRDYDVYGQWPVIVTDWYDVQQRGWKWSVIHVGWRRLPWVSFTGKRVLFHIGWSPMGNWATAFRIHGLGESPF